MKSKVYAQPVALIATLPAGPSYLGRLIQHIHIYLYNRPMKIHP